ncbi:MAG: hypothetical protein OEY59_03400 [Deltaproteobacteria bacterium]|nr:hypothetical protein [Deltaproteobacteria bacterium]
MLRIFWVAVFLLPVIFSFPSKGYSDEMISVSTGGKNSLSWSFVEELSKRWQWNFPQKEEMFQPAFKSDFKERLVDLSKNYCKFAIAPLGFIPSEEMLESPIRLVAVLWEVYLIPFSATFNQRNVGLQHPGPWYLPEGAVILEDYFQTSPEETNRLNFVKADGIQEFLDGFEEGVFFYEAIGSTKNVERMIGKKLFYLGLDEKFIEEIDKKNPWIEKYKFRDPRRNLLETVSYKMALYVNFTVEPEMIKELLKMLKSSPKTILPAPIIFDYLMISQTKKVERSLLHEGSQSFFF